FGRIRSAEERHPVGTVGNRARTRARKCHIPELGIGPFLPREQQTGFRMIRGPDMDLLLFARGAEHPFREIVNRKPAPLSRSVSQAQQHHFYRRTIGGKYCELMLDLMSHMLIDRVALAVANHIWIRGFAGRRRRWGPDLAGDVVADVDYFRL